jgi:hypothetical protein
MGVIANAAGTYYTYKFLRILTRDWKDMPAFKNGIIDENGKVLRKSNTLNTSEKDEYTTFHRMVFNIKRLLEKLPINNKLSSYAAALFLLKEEYDINIDDVLPDLFTNELQENVWFVQENGQLSPGEYSLSTSIFCPTYDTFYNKGSAISITEDCKIGELGGCNIYNVTHVLSGNNVNVTAVNLKKGKL